MIKRFASLWFHRACPTPAWRALCIIRREIRRFLTDQSSLRTTVRFLSSSFPGVGLADRIRLVRRFRDISRRIDCPHSEHEMLEVAAAILSFPRGAPGCIVEAGCYKGGSAAKMSLAAALAGRDLYLFDSFEGLPDNEEEHYTTAAADAGAGKKVYDFAGGNYAGSLEEVQRHIREYGDLSRCRFRKGWFSETMPGFLEPVCIAYVDVDLVMSTKDCIGNLHRVLVPGGKIYSQDGHLAKIQELFSDSAYWTAEVGCHPPRIQGLGVRRMVTIQFA